MSKTMTAPDGMRKNHYIRNTVLQSITLHSCEKKKRSILIEAQAGQGKTTLARQYLAHVTTPGAWYPLSPEDNDAIVLIDRLYSLLKHSVKGFSSRLIATMLSKGELSYQAVGKYARILLTDLKRALKHDLYIVFDDIHLIEDSPAALKFLSALTSGVGSPLHFILISRRPIPREVRSVFQSGHCVYLDSKALAFSKKETREFVHECMEIPLSRKQLNQLYETTHGWVMGLRSKCLTLKSHGPVDLAPEELLQGDAEQDYHYFAEEVYPGIASVVSKPMLKLALLDEIPLALAEKTGDDYEISEKLVYLCRNNFFLSQWGDQGDIYTFHHLFRDFLRVKCRQQFSQEDIADFLIRAGRWYTDENQIKKALTCFLKAKNYDEIDALLEKHGLTAYQTGQIYCIHRLLEEAPEAIIKTRCWVSFFLGLLSVELDPSSAISYLNVSRTLFVSRNHLLGELLSTAELCFNHIFIDGQLKTGKALCPRAIELFGRLRDTLPPFYLARTANTLAICSFYYFGDTDASDAYLALVKEAARKHDMRGMLAESHTPSCFNSMGRGKFFKSAEELDAQLPYLSDPRVKDSTKSQARLVQLNQLEITGDFFNYHLTKPIIYRLTRADLIQSTILRDFTTIWDTCQALVVADTDLASKLINNALAQDEASQSPHLRSQFYHYQAYIYGLSKNPEKALEAAEKSVVLRQKARVPYFEALQAMILGGMYTQLNMRDKALDHLEKAIASSHKLKERFIRCGALSHRIWLYLQCDETDAALKDTKELLSLMQKERYVHFDSWVPQVMLPVLQFAHEQGIAMDYVRLLAAKRLNVSFDTKSRPLPILDITTLGRFSLRVEGKEVLEGTQLSHNEQRLLSAIIGSTSMSICVYDAFDRLWPESHEEKAMKSLNVLLFRLRKKISHPDINPDFDFQDYLQHKNKQLFLTHCRIDAHECRESAARGVTQFRNHQHWQASNSFRHALTLWTGPFLKSIACDDAAGEFNDHFLLNTLSKAATCWSTIIRRHGDSPQEDLALIEGSVSHGAGTPDMMRNLFDIYTASGDTRKIHFITDLYKKALLKTGYTEEEVDEEVEGLWAHDSRTLPI